MPRRRVVIDHVSIGVSDLARSRDFYRRALAPLGFAETGPWRDGAQDVAFGLAEADDFAISLAYPAGGSVHVAFAADRREQVDAFYEAAIAAGGRDNGPPARDLNTQRATTAHSSWTPTDTTSRPSTTAGRSRAAATAARE